MNKTDKNDAIIALTAAIREQANAYILNALSQYGIEDILPAHGAVFNALFKFGPLKMNELAERIKKKKNTVTGLISTLESRGYCRREPDPQDARVQLVLLTEKGESMREIQKKISAALLRLAWDNVDDSEQDACMRTLKKIFQNLEQNTSDNV